MPKLSNRDQAWFAVWFLVAYAIELGSLGSRYPSFPDPLPGGGPLPEAVGRPLRALTLLFCVYLAGAFAVAARDWFARVGFAAVAVSMAGLIVSRLWSISEPSEWWLQCALAVVIVASLAASVVRGSPRV